MRRCCWRTLYDYSGEKGIPILHTITQCRYCHTRLIWVGCSWEYESEYLARQSDKVNHEG